MSSPFTLWIRRHRRDVPNGSAFARLLVLVTAAGITAAPSQPHALARSSGAGSVTVRVPSVAAASVVRAVAPRDVRALNRHIPLASGANPASRPFVPLGAADTDRQRAVECMTAAIYYEAGNESEDGQRAVAQVILNRVRHPAYPASVCGVVYQGSTRSTGCQFTFTCDGSLLRQPNASSWSRARQVAEAALAGQVFAPVGLATHYHADYVLPYWAASLARNAVVGTHVFYRWPGQWGRPAAFAQRYQGAEPNSAALRQAALAALAARPAGRAVRGADPAAELAALEARIRNASASLGKQHPEMIALQKQRRALGAKAPSSRSAQLAAVNAELASARRTLGSRHPRIVALEEQRAVLSGKPRKPVAASAPATAAAASGSALQQ